MTQIIVSLDVDGLLDQEELLRKLKGTVTFYKVGLGLFTAHGKRSVDQVRRHGGKVFLDLKILDMPQAAARAVRAAHGLGVYALSLNLSGGLEMLKAATDVSPRPKLWGMTALTSMPEDELRVLHPRINLMSMSKRLVRAGWTAGLDGFICSAPEVEYLRRSLRHLDLRFITPGIRPEGSLPDEQKRVITPEEAARLEIDFILIGRPVTRAEDPLRAAQAIAAAMKRAAPDSI